MTKKRSKRDMIGGVIATFARNVFDRSYLRGLQRIYAACNVQRAAC
jgi:hypothetical protein